MITRTTLMNRILRLGLALWTFIFGTAAGWGDTTIKEPARLFFQLEKTGLLSAVLGKDLAVVLEWAKRVVRTVGEYGNICQEWKSSYQEVPGELIVLMIAGAGLLIASLIWSFWLVREAGKRSRELHDSEQKYRTLIDQSFEGIVVIDGNRIVFSNDRMSEITGYSREELLKLPADAIIHPDDRDMMRNRHRRRRAGEKIAPQSSFRLVAKDGRIHWLLANSGLVDWDGQQAILDLIADATESKVALETIRESESLFKTAMDAISDGLWDWNIQTGATYFSPRYYTMLGYEPGEFPASYESWKSLLHPDDAEQAISTVNKVLQAGVGQGYEVEFRMKRKTGEWTWILGRGKVIEGDENGRVRRMVGTHSDISQRKLADEALRFSEEKFSTAFMTFPDIVTINNLADQTYEDVNPSFSEVFGYTREEAIGKTSSGLNLWVFQDQRNRFFDQLMENGVVYNQEVTYQRKNGERFAGLVSARTLEIHGKRYSISITRDISRLKKADEALRKSEERYRRLFEDAVLGIFQIGLDGFLISANPAFVHMFGYDSVGELTSEPTNMYNQLYITPSNSEAILRWVEESEGAITLDTIFKRKDGTLFSGNQHIWKVKDPHDGSEYLEGFVEDITERKEAEIKIHRQLQHLAALRAVDVAITASVDLRETLSVLLEQVVAQLGVDAADVLLIERESGRLNYAGDLGFRTMGIQASSLEPGKGFAGKAALERHVVHAINLAGNPDYFLNSPMLIGEGFAEYYGVPLIAKDEVKGVLEVYHRAHLNSDADWMRLLEALAGQAAIAVDNATLFDGLQRANTELVLAYDATIEGWARALELRDGETEDHSQRVTSLTISLAHAMGVRGEDLVHARRGALLHDIGKMSIPDSILLKPGPLTDAEWEIMRQHPEFAYKLLYPIQFLRPALDIPYCHHERWDGSGYPRGLKGEQIPLVARVFTVVDVWDALCSDRPYRKAWKVDQVRAYIQSRAGQHFDQTVVDRFLKM